MAFSSQSSTASGSNGASGPVGLIGSGGPPSDGGGGGMSIGLQSMFDQGPGVFVIALQFWMRSWLVFPYWYLTYQLKRIAPTRKNPKSDPPPGSLTTAQKVETYLRQNQDILSAASLAVCATLGSRFIPWDKASSLRDMLGIQTGQTSTSGLAGGLFWLNFACLVLVALLSTTWRICNWTRRLCLLIFQYLYGEDTSALDGKTPAVPPQRRFDVPEDKYSAADASGRSTGMEQRQTPALRNRRQGDNPDRVNEPEEQGDPFQAEFRSKLEAFRKKLNVVEVLRGSQGYLESTPEAKLTSLQVHQSGLEKARDDCEPALQDLEAYCDEEHRRDLIYDYACLLDTFGYFYFEVCDVSPNDLDRASDALCLALSASVYSIETLLLLSKQWSQERWAFLRRASDHYMNTLDRCIRMLYPRKFGPSATRIKWEEEHHILLKAAPTICEDFRKLMTRLDSFSAYQSENRGRIVGIASGLYDCFRAVDKATDELARLRDWLDDLFHNQPHLAQEKVSWPALCFRSCLSIAAFHAAEGHQQKSDQRRTQSVSLFGQLSPQDQELSAYISFGYLINDIRKHKSSDQIDTPESLQRSLSIAKFDLRTALALLQQDALRYRLRLLRQKTLIILDELPAAQAAQEAAELQSIFPDEETLYRYLYDLLRLHYTKKAILARTKRADASETELAQQMSAASEGLYKAALRGFSQQNYDGISVIRICYRILDEHHISYATQTVDELLDSLFSGSLSNIPSASADVRGYKAQASKLTRLWPFKS